MGGSGEKVMPTLLFSVTLILTMSLLVTLLGDMQTHNEINAKSPALSTPAQLLLENYNLIPYDPAVEVANATKLDGTNAWQKITFTRTGYTETGCVIIRNFTTALYWYLGSPGAQAAMPWSNYPSDTYLLDALGRIPKDNDGWKPTDFIMFWQSWLGGTLNTNRYIRYYVMTFDEIVASAEVPNELFRVNENGTTNVSQTTFHIRYWETAFITWNMGNGTLAPSDSALYANRFNVSLGAAINSTLTSGNPWSLLAEIAVLSPHSGLPDILRYLMAIPIWFTLGFAIVMILIWAFSL